MPDLSASPSAADLRQAMIAGIAKKDVAAVRHALETAGVHGYKLQPNAAMLLVAAHEKDRATCQLLMAYGASWTPAQYTIAEKGKILSVVPEMMHDMRRFKPHHTQADIDKKDIFRMLHDIHNTFGENEPFLIRFLESRIFEEAFEKNNIADIRTYVAYSPNNFLDVEKILYGHFTSPEYKKNTLNIFQIFDAEHSKKIKYVRSLLKENIPITKLRPRHDSWVEELHEWGLLDSDQSVLRQKLIHELAESYSNYKKKGYGAPYMSYENKTRLAILCSPDYPISSDEADAFMELKIVRKDKDKAFLSLLCDVGYFASPAFSHIDLSKLTPMIGGGWLKKKFNHQAMTRRYHNIAGQYDWDGISQNAAEKAKQEVEAFEKKHHISICKIPPRGHYAHAVDLPPLPPKPPQTKAKPTGIGHTGAR